MIRTRYQSAIVVVVLTVVAFLLRSLVASSGGIWADEAFLLLVTQSASVRSMVEFLHFHESHPPLFYFLMRGWKLIAGNGDFSARLFVTIIGALIVPAVYVAGRRLFSQRSAAFAAGLVAFSPALIEHSSQLRPYGFMSLLVLASSCTLIAALARGRRADWALYVVTTSLLLYTHNWGWLVVVGQALAVSIVASTVLRSRRQQAGWSWLTSVMLIGALYSPWAQALIFQATHAGHGGVDLENFGDAIALLLFGVFTSVTTLLFGRLTQPAAVVAAGMLAGIAVFFLVAKSLKPNNNIRSYDSDRNRGSDRSMSHTAATGLLAIIVGALTAAILLTPFSQQLLARCISTLIPVTALVLAHVAEMLWRQRKRFRLTAAASAGVFVFVGIASVIELYELSRTPRSNAREAAKHVRSRMRHSDMLVVVPEWFAPAFNHYFPPSIEQVDFPHSGRSNLIDFAEKWTRASSSLSFDWLSAHLARASTQNRRVWLVSDARYLRPVTSESIARARKRQDAAVFAALRTGQIKASLDRLYGQPDSVTDVNKTHGLYDNLRVYLYVPTAERGRK